MRIKKLLLALMSFPALLLAFPPPVPSAGVVEREIEREYESKPLEIDKEIPSVEVDIPEEKLSFAPGVKVFVHEVRIEGNQAISEGEIQGWLEPYLDRTLDIQEIYQLCKEIDCHYAAKGYFLSRAYPPPQEIHDGVLVIRILEGKIGTIRIEGNEHYSTEFICKYFERFCDETLCYDDFLKALLLLNEYTDLSAGAVFEKGQEVGTADLIVRVNDKRPMHLYLNENNYGRDLTTNTQLGGRFDWGNCIFQGDKLTIAEVVGFPVDALYFTDAVYTVPLNARGTFLEVSGLYTKFHVEELRSLHLKGQSAIATVKGTHALMRTKRLNLDVFGYFDYKMIQNYVLGHQISYDKLRVLTGGLRVDHYNLCGGRDYFNARIGAGLPDFLGGMNAVSHHSSRRGGGGRFVQINADYDRVQRLYKEYALYFHASGQWSPSKLTQPQQIYIGGSNTVRGFPLSVALGDSGYYANLEARAPLPFLEEEKFCWSDKKWKEAVQVVGFFDTGGTKFNSGPSTFISGMGVGVRILFPYTIALSFDVGFPLNHRDLSNAAFCYLKITAQPF